MTEGAKTGTLTPRTDGFRRSLQDSTGLTVPYFGALKLAYELETDLTEALKVAGEALEKIESELTDTQWQPMMRITEARSVISVTLAALERIRNNKH